MSFFLRPKAGYETGFYGKRHLGDIEQSYPYNQGFDDAFVAIDNQVVSLWNVQGEAVNATIRLKEQILPTDPYQLNDKFDQKGFVLYIEGKKGEQGKEWGAAQTPQDYATFDGESEKRALAFMSKSGAGGKPFYVAWWPLFTSFTPDPKKVSLQRGLVGDGYEKMLDPAAGRLVDFPRSKGLAENTLIFRGGKGDATEGGA